MKRSLSSWLLLASLLPACIDDDAIVGSGRLVETKADVPPFHAVEVADGLPAVIAIGEQDVFLRLDDNIQSHVHVYVRNGVLVLEARDPDMGFDPSPQAVIQVATPTLDAVIAKDGSRVRAEANTRDVHARCSDGADLELDVRGADRVVATSEDGCSAVIRGAAPVVSLAASDGSRLTSDIAAEEATIRAEDGSKVRAHVTKTARVTAEDGSEVYIHGNPPGREVSESDGASVRFE